MVDWYEDDSFWITMAPFMFGEEAWARAETEVDALLALAEVGPGSAVLDMGCGPGRHSLELARRDFTVTGVDRTRVYLAQARERASAEELAIEFVQADMRDFRRPDTYDLALSLFTTFGYFEDANENLQVLKNVHDCLRQGGRLVMETMGKEVIARIYQRRDWDERDGVYFLQDRVPTRNWSWMDATWIAIDGGEHKRYQFGHWIYSAVELTAMFKEVGFSHVNIYGSLEGEAYDTNARRLAAVASK